MSYNVDESSLLLLAAQEDMRQIRKERDSWGNTGARLEGIVGERWTPNPGTFTPKQDRVVGLTPSELLPESSKTPKPTLPPQEPPKAPEGKPVLTEPMKYDAGKSAVHLIPVYPLMQLGEVLRFGAEKYCERNWEPGLKWSRVYASTLRHLFAWWSGEDKDPESGLSHLSHAMTNIVFLSEYEHTRKGTDDRPGSA